MEDILKREFEIKNDKEIIELTKKYTIEINRLKQDYGKISEESIRKIIHETIRESSSKYSEVVLELTAAFAFTLGHLTEKDRDIILGFIKNKRTRKITESLIPTVFEYLRKK